MRHAYHGRVRTAEGTREGVARAAGPAIFPNLFDIVVRWRGKVMYRPLDNVVARRVVTSHAPSASAITPLAPARLADPVAHSSTGSALSGRFERVSDARVF
ncbi:conserved hypothetical protein [Streptomyces sviceus ATCC 29083]|uniref:Uncharacterized protein n=1 Tax=Streptomyces sviceus (strain ATCC 29083 / DSM 924 / JCM 4929 / NBRC 13980 / NCIMB 11184 / NRRL 5439 / UC 5370) TaxID=463191 RepID=B5HTD0_STRX2|nr:conserved hypothetical protein [Streptomyces sviceus ATCC 29083]